LHWKSSGALLLYAALPMIRSICVSHQHVEAGKGILLELQRGGLRTSADVLGLSVLIRLAVMMRFAMTDVHKSVGCEHAVRRKGAGRHTALEPSDPVPDLLVPAACIQDKTPVCI
jgi:hypothetical protein